MADTRSLPRIQPYVMLAFGAGAVLFFAAWRTFEPGASTASTDDAYAENRSLIGELLGRDFIVLIYGGESELRYEIQAYDGTIIATDLTREDLDRSYPDVDLDSMISREPGDPLTAPLMMVPTE